MVGHSSSIRQKLFPGLFVVTPSPLNCRIFALVSLPVLLRFPFASVEDANIEAGPTLGVAVLAWLFGLAGTFTILLLRSRVTSDQEGPFRKCLTGRSGATGRALPGRNNNNIGTV